MHFLNILLIVFFNHPRSGLQENIRATIVLILKQGHSCTLLCREGLFADEIRALGVSVVTTDFTEDGNAAAVSQLNAANTLSPFHLVHTHPFHSRKIAQQLTKQWNVPLVTTIHGRYTDDLEINHADFSTIFTVSNGIRDYLIEHVGPDIAQHIVVAPNGVQLNNFPKPQSTGAFVDLDTAITPKIALVSRFDKDKTFILDTFVEAIRELVARNAKFKLVLVGQGTMQLQLIQQLTELVGQDIDYRGWLTGKALVQAYYAADIVVAPGRCALEAMASGKPTIAIGSKGYSGLINAENWQNGVYSNFGGIGNQESDYPEHALANDIEPLLTNELKRQQLGQFSRQLVELFYDEDAINHKTLGVYRMLVI